VAEKRVERAYRPQFQHQPTTNSTAIAKSTTPQSIPDVLIDWNVERTKESTRRLKHKERLREGEGKREEAGRRLSVDAREGNKNGGVSILGSHWGFRDLGSQECGSLRRRGGGEGVWGDG
jgi:hypothetical protein